MQYAAIDGCALLHDQHHSVKLNAPAIVNHSVVLFARKEKKKMKKRMNL
jgi:hypothetical protein